MSPDKKTTPKKKVSDKPKSLKKEASSTKAISPTKIAVPKKKESPSKKKESPHKKKESPHKKKDSPHKKEPIHKEKSLKLFPVEQDKLLDITSKFRDEMAELEQEDEHKPQLQKFSQESSFSSVTKDGHTNTVNSLKASISLPDPEKTKQMCDKISERDSNIECVYNEKENTCYIDGTSVVNKTFNALKERFGFNHGTESDKLKELLNENILPHQTKVTPTMIQSPFNKNLSVPKIIFIRKPMLSPPNMGHFSGSPFMRGGGSSLGRVNGCPDNGRLIYDAEGKIGCGNIRNQGGQKFMYPKTINNFVGGKKKSLKKKKQRGGEEGDTYKLNEAVEQGDYKFLEPLNLPIFIKEAIFVEKFRDDNRIYCYIERPKNPMDYINKEKYPDVEFNTSGNQVILEPSSPDYEEYDFPPIFRFKEEDLIKQ